MASYEYDTYMFFAFFAFCILLTAFLIWRTKAYYCKIGWDTPAQRENDRPQKDDEPSEKTSKWNDYWNKRSDQFCLISFLFLLPILFYSVVIGVYCLICVESFWSRLYEWKEIIGATYAMILTVYTALYAITWAKYEFEVNRQSHELSVISALMATENRKSFAPQLARLTRKQIFPHPNLFSFKQIVNATLGWFNEPPQINNRHIIDAAAIIVKGFDNWEKAFFSRINLPGTDLRDAKLQGAHLLGANFQGTDLQGANLQGANLLFANLQGADLHRVNFQGADLQSANLKGAELPGANLRYSRLRGANFQGANLRHAQLQGADLPYAIFQGADLSYSNLSEINLHPWRFFYETSAKGRQLGLSAEPYKLEYEKNMGQAASLYEAKLDPEIKQRLLIEHPYLFSAESSPD